MEGVERTYLFFSFFSFSGGLYIHLSSLVLRPVFTARLLNIQKSSRGERFNGLCSSAVVLVRGSFNRLDSKYPSFFMEPDIPVDI